MFQFAIMGAGNIAAAFCRAAELLEDCRVAAVASKSIERAKAFAGKNHVPVFYGNYEEMLEKERPDCVYIATTGNDHYKLCKLCLKHRVPVLCEKAFVSTGRQAREIFDMAQKEGVFVMEAMWSRFLPSVLKAKEWADSGKIGTITFGECAIGFTPERDRTSRYFNAGLAGGAALDLMVYDYELMTYFIKEKIQEIKPTVIWSDTGVDLSESVTVRFENAVGVLNASLAAPMEEKLVLYGTKGKIVIPRPHMAMEALLYGEDGSLTEHFEDKETKFGFVYEIEEVIRCIKEGKIESDVVPHSLTIACGELFDLIWNEKRENGAVALERL